MPLSPQRTYAPYGRGRYTTTPSLAPLESDPGLIRLDDRFDVYRTGKLEAVATHPERHTLSAGLDAATAGAAVALLADRMAVEYPDRFVRAGDTLACRLTGERVVLAPDAAAFFALCLQVQEDFALVRHTPERGDWNAALHVCAPSRWAPEEKIGRSFVETHVPVPGMEPTLAAADALVGALIARGPFVRYNWGIAFDARLNLHTALPAPVFDGSGLWVRVERQVLWPLPDVRAFLFAIRVYLYDVQEMDTEGRRSLIAALESMSPPTRDYKGLSGAWGSTLAWLRASVGQRASS